MKNEVGPAASRSLAKLSLIPRTTEAIATTTNTPIATPMIVSAARTLFERIESTAMPTPSSALKMRCPIRMLFLPQSFDRVERCGSAGRIYARDDSDDGSEKRRHDDGPGGDGGRQRSLPLHDLGDGDTEQNPDDSAERAQRRGFDQELAHDVAPPSAG